MTEIIIPDPVPVPNANELRVLRRQTKAYIAESPASISFNRGGAVPDGAGGTINDPGTNLPPQTVRVIKQRESGATERRNVAGEVVRPSLVVMAEWDADMQRDDTFQWDGLTCEIVWVTDMGYELLGEVNVV